MNITLISFVVLYLLGTLALGVWAGSRIKNTSDFAIAGRSLPLIMVITTTFATWFGAETVMGMPSNFVKGGLNAIVEDPLGAGMCLVLVGAFFATKLYRQNLLTIGDFYRQRYGKGIEVFCSTVIILSYLGWVAAQITALGLVFNVLSQGAMSETAGMIVGTLAVLIYVVIGGFIAVAWTDFIQVIVLVVGLSVIAVFSADLAGGADKVFGMMQSQDLYRFWPELNFTDVAMFIGAALTLMLGSIPQQDVFQRVMAAKDEKTARRGAMIGGAAYILFAAVPVFIVCSAVVVMGQQALDLMGDEVQKQKILPMFVMGQMPLIMQILFFGALLSAIKSTSSATLLAPTTSFVENILKNLRPNMSDRQQLLAMRLTLTVFAGLVLAYSIGTKGTPIYEMVKNAYKVTLVGAFVPLVFGLYWQRATTQGAIFSVAAGIGVWVLFMPEVSGLDGVFPGQLAGLLAAIVGMIFGSLAPQWLKNRHEHKRHVAGLPDEASA